jgi:hypothetical protein
VGIVHSHGEASLGLTLKQIENAAPKDKAYKLADSGGLCLLIAPSGAKLWRWRYRFAGKEKMMALGEFPVITLKEARERHFEVRKILEAGSDPMAERKAEALAKDEESKAEQRQAERSFETVARAWWAWWSIGKSPRHAETVMNRLEADVFPAIGHLFADAVEPGHVRDILVTVESRGASDVAKRAQQTIGQIFRFAISRDLATRNPAADFKPRDILAARESQNFARVEERYLGQSFNRALTQNVSATSI